MPDRANNGIRHDVLVSSWEVSRGHCQRRSEIYSTRERSRHKCQQVGGIWTLGGVWRPRAGELNCDSKGGCYRLDLWGKKELGSRYTTTRAGFSQAGHVTNEKPVTPSAIIAPIGHVGHQEELVVLRHELRDSELEIEEADVPRLPAKVYTPRNEEYNRHCGTHLLYRSPITHVQRPQSQFVAKCSCG